MSDQTIPDPPQIPTPDELTTPFIDALVRIRPRALGPINSEKGQYANIVAGLKAETRLLRARLADEAVAARLPLATGRTLRELARSEYWVDADVGPKAAIGGVVLQRVIHNENPGTTNNFPHGVILSGTEFKKVQDPNASPPVAAANYAVTTPLVCDRDDTEPIVELTPEEAIIAGGTFRHTQRVIVTIQASQTGPDANTPIFIDTAGNFTEFPTLAAFDRNLLFDPSFTVLLGGASGGSNGLSDAGLRRLAQANYIGIFNPTDGAVLAGALSGTGIEHVALVNDPTTAVTKVFATDASWGASGPHLAVVEQVIKDDWQGFGCAVKVFPVYNQRITVTATVCLVDKKHLSELTELTKIIGTKLRSYFDDRLDWYTWKRNTIAAMIAGSDRRILTVQDPKVLDGAGAELAEPPVTVAPTAQFGRHFYLTDNNVRLNFTGPVA